MIFRFFKEIYLTAFTVLFRLNAWGPRTARGASVALIALIESGVLLGIDLLVDDFSGITLLPTIPKWAFIVIYFAIAVLNFYVLVFRRHGVKFEREFSHFKTGKKIQLILASVAVMLAAIALFIYAANVHRNIIAHNR
jgi:hypothetical protein